MSEPSPSYQPQPVQPLTDSDARMWATLIHVGGILFGFVSPLVGYLVLKDRSAFVAANSRNALNFQLTMLIAYIAGVILTFVVIGVVVLLAVWVLNIVLSIIAALAANRGEVYKYPLTIEFVK